jgi:cellulose synthase/poly-beta-1,6-N-acetylglucosamine synthase-like glycosyltransferase
MNVGPGEDLEITLRIRKAGYLVRFAENALAETTVPQSVAALIRQRIRWDGDAVAIRLLMYDETSFFDRRESSSDVFQRLDYIFLELVPALVFPFYLMTLWLDYGYNMIDVLIAIYFVLFWLYFFNLILAIIMTRRRLSVLDLLVLVLMPIYLGLLMRLIRLVAISYEILWARSQKSPFVPSRIREALYGRLK